MHFISVFDVAYVEVLGARAGARIVLYMSKTTYFLYEYSFSSQFFFAYFVSNIKNLAYDRSLNSRTYFDYLFQLCLFHFLLVDAML